MHGVLDQGGFDCKSRAPIAMLKKIVYLQDLAVEVSSGKEGLKELREKRAKDGSKMQTSFCGQRISLNWVSWLLCGPGVEAVSEVEPLFFMEGECNVCRRV